MEVVSRGNGNGADVGSVTMGDVGGFDIDMDMNVVKDNQSSRSSGDPKFARQVSIPTGPHLNKANANMQTYSQSMSIYAKFPAPLFLKYISLFRCRCCWNLYLPAIIHNNRFSNLP